MKFTEALEIIRKDSKKCMYRDNWNFDLHFYEFLTLRERNGDTVSIYTIHHFDFEYEWKIKD